MEVVRTAFLTVERGTVPFLGADWTFLEAVERFASVFAAVLLAAWLLDLLSVFPA